ncbi:MAG: fasciclin domain-containing protein [Acinetobacter sp.]|nr:MAG: fasciclin domain-containing protein [Acinetobacter sp.]
MKNFINSRNVVIVAIICAFAIALFNSCKREEYTQSTTDDVNITGYLDKYPDQYSLMTQIIKRSGTAGYLGAYGKFTLFTPTNDAVTAWLKSQNKTGVDQLSVAEAVDMVKYHLLPDTIATNRFTDGKLPQITLYGQYLQTGALNTAGSTSFVVNKSALITKSNIRVGNGIIHAINHVLQPATLSSAQQIEANSRYTIFTQALKETGFYDSLNVKSVEVKDTTRRFQTVILESDSALKAAGFANYAALKARFSKTGDPKNHADSLWLYVAYHISTGPNYTPDIIQSSALYTLAPKEIVTTKFAGTKILLNDDEFNGKIEPGVEVNRTYSDISTSNGVIHEAKAFYGIKVRQQVPVYWDVADQPELRANPKWRGAAAGGFDIVANNASLLAGFNGDRLNQRIPNYYFSPAIGGTRQYAYGDQLQISMAVNNNARLKWFELRTPMLVKGKYRVWICYAQNAKGVVGQVTMDPGKPQEQVLPNLIDFRQYLGSSGVDKANFGLATTDGFMFTNGFKRYMANTNEYSGTVRGAMAVNGDTMVGRLVGTADIQTTDRHWIRITAIGGDTQDNNTLIDMIHFIPLDADQNFPRFHQSNTLFYRP